jgi:hypothetical protein
LFLIPDLEKYKHKTSNWQFERMPIRGFY